MEYLSIPHYRGLKEKYNEQSHGDGIFFTTDTHEIIANSATYGETIDTWSIADGVLTLTMTSGKTLKITFDEASENAKGLLSAADKKIINNLDNTYISKTKDSTDVQIADGSTLAINKFVGDLTYDSTTGELFVGYPTSKGESIVTQVVALPEATEDTAGLLSANDKSKLNTLNWETID